MALVNQKTGQTVSDMQRSDETIELIGQQELKIFSVTSQNTKLVQENLELQAQISEIPKMKNTIGNLNEKLNESENAREEAEAHVKDLKSELEREKNKKPQTVTVTEKRCKSCYREKYMSLSDEAFARIHEVSIKENEVERRTVNLKKEYDTLDSIVKREVDKIVKRKTVSERVANHMVYMKNRIDFELTILPLIYAIITTVITVIRSSAVKEDIISAAEALKNIFVWIFTFVKNIITKAAGVTASIENAVVSKILWWVIVILLILVALALLGLIGFGIFKLIHYIIEEHEEKFNFIFFSYLLADLAAVTYLGDLVKGVISFNLCITFFLAIAAYFFVIYGLPVIIPAILRGIEKFGRSL